MREELRPRLTRNEVLDVSGKAMQLFAVLNLGDEHRDPIALQIEPPTTREEHAELKARPLPVIPSTAPQSMPISQPVSSQAAARQAKLQRIFQGKNRLRP